MRYYCGGQGTEDTQTLETYRALYRGDRAATISLIRRTFQADIGDQERLSESARNFGVTNEFRAIIDRRIGAMPSTFMLAESDLDYQEDCAKWADGLVTKKGGSLYSLWRKIRRDQERDGACALVVYGKPGAVRVDVRDTDRLSVLLDPVTSEPSEYRFEWEVRQPGGDVQKFSEVYTEKTRTVEKAGTKTVEPHNFGFIPVVLIQRIEDHDFALSPSGGAELIQGYAFLLWTVYLLNVLNKFEAHGVYGPKNDDGAMLGDGTTGQAANISLFPGCWIPVPGEKIGGNITAGPLLRQLEFAMESLYRIGMVKPDRAESVDMRSGKAMLIGSQELTDYTAEKCDACREGLSKVLDMWAWIEGKVPVGKPSGLSVAFPQIGDDDQAENTKRAELWAKAKELLGFELVDILNAWQRLGMLDDDADIPEMAARIEAAQEAGQQAQMAAMVAELRRGQPQPQEDDRQDIEDARQPPEVVTDAP